MSRSARLFRQLGLARGLHTRAVAKGAALAARLRAVEAELAALQQGPGGAQDAARHADTILWLKRAEAYRAEVARRRMALEAQLADARRDAAWSDARCGMLERLARDARKEDIRAGERKAERDVPVTYPGGRRR